MLSLDCFNVMQRDRRRGRGDGNTVGGYVFCPSWEEEEEEAGDAVREFKY